MLLIRSKIKIKIKIEIKIKTEIKTGNTEPSHSLVTGPKDTFTQPILIFYSTELFS